MLRWRFHSGLLEIEKSRDGRFTRLLLGYNGKPFSGVVKPAWIGRQKQVVEGMTFKSCAFGLGCVTKMIRADLRENLLTSDYH